MGKFHFKRLKAGQSGDLIFSNLLLHPSRMEGGLTICRKFDKTIVESAADGKTLNRKNDTCHSDQMDITMKRAGRVIQEAVNGKGLISSSGNQFEFEIAGMWKSDTAPEAHMVVEFKLDADGKVSAVSVIRESNLAKEHAEKAMQLAHSCWRSV